MKIVFFASDDFALPALEAVARSRHTLVEIVTTPDRKKGRGLQSYPTPPKSWAMARGVPARDWDSPNTPDPVAHLRELGAHAAIVASYGRMLSGEILALFEQGCLNIHPSLLPLYRGASPVAESLLRGDRVVGVTVIRLVQAMDAGDILAQRSVTLEGNEGAMEVRARLAEEGARMMVEVLDALEDGTASPPRAQDHSRASYCRKLVKEDARIDWSLPAAQIARRVRAFEGWPGTFCLWRGKRLVVTRVGGESAGSGAPGVITGLDARRGIGVAAGEGTVWLTRVKPEGGREILAKDFVNGHRITLGEKFE